MPPTSKNKNYKKFATWQVELSLSPTPFINPSPKSPLHFRNPIREAERSERAILLDACLVPHFWSCSPLEDYFSVITVFNALITETFTLLFFFSVNYKFNFQSIYPNLISFYFTRLINIYSTSSGMTSWSRTLSLKTGWASASHYGKS